MHASCQCGALSARIAEGAEPMVVACHCLDCQKRSGSPFGAMAYYPPDQVTVAGEAREYSRPTDSGHVFTTGFCTGCGSTLYGKSSRLPQIIGITIGTIGDPSFPAPTRSVYERRRHRWLTMPETTEGFERVRDGTRNR